MLSRCKILSSKPIFSSASFRLANPQIINYQCYNKSCVLAVHFFATVNMRVAAHNCKNLHLSSQPQTIAALTPIHVKCKQAGSFMQKYDRASRGELLFHTDRPRMMNGSASVSNCISILCACIANKEESEWERESFFLGMSGCLCFSVGHVRRKRLAGEEYPYTDKLHNTPAGHSERGCFFFIY